MATQSPSRWVRSSGSVTGCPLMQFTARVGGRPAHVKVFASRFVWTVAGTDRVTEMVPLTAISSVATTRTGPESWCLVVCANGKSLEFQVEATDAEAALPLLQRLVLQRHPAGPPSSAVDDAPPSGRGNLAEDLIYLNWLLDNGILTVSEFDARRARLFGIG